ncbi:MAG: DUF378 domain-containing protein [Candidatus Liptonbacteria bacterium CG11_big_fil_rev_8_21_14_0_20_35_14]|uniref:DUF378 domain-containing protein n=1 Tax=Candidatus Liptonbacteria bacterium CG11_big_fil_rev_8_21_14_0_20_35_14 TaxID=1974634 RepID=A0A2H0N757_9BACT|nr:MAG: DUF378 domain-containing protein [Candidatus Liptonbacteria bacterium CG11_big_fil_rev_8_21_14_0_20_35_14]
MKALHMVSFILLIIGGLNWLVFGITGVEIGKYVGGMDGTAATVIYILVGLAAIYEVVTHKNTCKACTSKTS